MKQSFSTQQPAAPEASSPASTPPAENTAASPAVRQDQSPAVPQNTGGVQGYVDTKDLQLPRVNIAQKAGDLGESFPPGSIVLSKDLSLCDEKGTTPAKITVLQIKVQFQEKLPYDPDSDVRPKIFDTPDEVKAAGGSLQFGDEHYYQRMGTMLCLVEAPEGISEDDRDAHFIYECEGRYYALALWTVTSSAYTAFGKPVVTAFQIGHLKGNRGSSRSWIVTTTKKTGNGNSWYVPNGKPGEKTSEAFQAFAAEILG